jgi:hypothetical protein
VLATSVKAFAETLIRTSRAASSKSIGISSVEHVELFDKRNDPERNCPEWLRLVVGFRSGARSVGNCPSFSDQQHRLLDGKRQDVPDACSSEIDVVDDVSQFLYQAYAHRVRVVAQSADLMPFCLSCHHPCNIAAR